jgi:hypothetical protein
MIKISILFLLQTITAFVYYYLLPFSLNPWVYVILAINNATLLGIWLSYWREDIDLLSNAFNAMRIIFTVTLALLEILMDMDEASIVKDTAQSLSNDFEVLFTGIVLGVLWQDKIVKHKAHR